MNELTNLTTYSGDAILVGNTAQTKKEHGLSYYLSEEFIGEFSKNKRITDETLQGLLYSSITYTRMRDMKGKPITAKDFLKSVMERIGKKRPGLHLSRFVKEKKFLFRYSKLKGKPPKHLHLNQKDWDESFTEGMEHINQTKKPELLELLDEPSKNKDLIRVAHLPQAFILSLYEVTGAFLTLVEETISMETEELEELKSWFVKGRDDKTFQEYLDKKTKELLGLDLETWLEQKQKSQ